MPYTTGTRLAAVLLGYVALIIVLLTLNPFYFVRPTHVQLSLLVVPRDLIQNIILFLPMGYLYRLTSGSRRGALLLGATLSASVEAIQLFMPMRFPSPVDLVTNTLGAWVGAWLYDRLAARIALTPAMVGRLALEVPLMGLLYLLVPLLWMNGLARALAPDRWVLTVLIGMAGALLLSDLARVWWGAAGRGAPWQVALAAGAWFLLGAGPGLLRPLPAVPITIGVALVAATGAALPWHAADRRFEQTTLRRLLPILALYLLLVALWPPARSLGPWHGMLGLTNRSVSISPFQPAPLLEYLAAFTVLGYVSAEWRGRLERSLRHDLPQLLLVPLISALTLEGLVGFQVGHGASLIRAVLVVVGALLGGMIYHRQREHIRCLRSQGAALAPDGEAGVGLAAPVPRR